MNSERWRRIALLFEEALAASDDARSEFIDTVCAGDAELRKELLSLLRAHVRSDPTRESLPTSWLAALAADAPRFTAGERIADRYEIRQLLGRGGMGDVYEAWDEELAIAVALKTLHVTGASEEAHSRLQLEGFLARAVCHPHVCRMYDLGRHGEGKDEAWFLTMEVLRGPTLSELLHEIGRLPLDRALRFAEQMATGLGAAHQAGVVHRDFKPGNVQLVTKEDGEHAIVTDFGIARALSERSAVADLEASSGWIAGTPAYMAPEQLSGDGDSPAVDIYALGVVLHQMVTGVLPSGEAPSPREIAPGLNERWEQVISRCLEREPERRFARAEDVAAALAGRAPLEGVESHDASGRGSRTLPTERDAFVGREADLEALERALAGGARLVTLVGPGGMGKTRLAAHYGRRSRASWPGGVWFCDLTEAITIDAIALSVGRSLGVQLGRGDPIQQLGHSIAGRGRCLVILDNFEQLIGHGPTTIGRWLERASGASFLVTSRERLGLAEIETVQAVESLAPEAALDLFAVRARWLRPGLELAGPEAEAAREIVRLVDGMPLAIELAAARMRVMDAVQIVQQLRKRFRLLTGGGSARHETLAAAIDGSWELLSSGDRTAWAQCSIFEGGFTLEAAVGVLDLGVSKDARSALEVIQSLVDKSLLRATVSEAWPRHGPPAARFGMYVSLQEYARIRLREDPCERDTEQRHGEWYARYGAPETLSALKERGGLAQRRQFERELDNLIAACRRAMMRGDAAIAVATYGAAWGALELRGPFGVAVNLGRELLAGPPLERVEEASVARMLAQAEWFSGMVEQSRAHLDAALAVAREARDRRLESLILGDLGGMQVNQDLMEEGSVHLEAALDGARAVGDLQLECNTLNTLSVTRRGQGRLENASEYAELALQLARSSGDRRLEGSVLSNLGLLLQDQGRNDEARAHYEAALAIHREVGNRRFEGSAHTNLGGLHCDQGRMDEGRVHLEAALVIHRESGARFSEGIVRINLGFMYHTLEMTDEARAQYEGALAIERELGNRRLEGSILAALGRLHQDRGESDAARSLYESALALHRATNDRRSEGMVLAYSASLLQQQGSLVDARGALATGERLLREMDAPLELGQLLCIRAEIEWEDGDAPAAHRTHDEAEELAARIGSGPDSELGRMLSRLRRTLHIDPRETASS